MNGGWIHYLKRYGTGVPAAGVGLDAATFGGELRQDRNTLKPIVVDAGKRIATKLAEAKRL